MILSVVAVVIAIVAFVLSIINIIVAYRLLFKQQTLIAGLMVDKARQEGGLGAARIALAALRQVQLKPEQAQAPPEEKKEDPEGTLVISQRFA